MSNELPKTLSSSNGNSIKGKSTLSPEVDYFICYKIQKKVEPPVFKTYNTTL